MNISYNWLKRYINLDIPAVEVGKILTSIGLEVGSIEEVQTVKGGLEGLLIGKVLTCEAHENSDHLHVTTVDLGMGEIQQIVCGAPNVAAGQKVIVAPIGTILYAGEETFTIKRSKIRGVESFGMICAEDEIGIGTSHDGIIVLPADAEIGMLAKDYYGIHADFLIEVDITPNRVDAASHYGVARDLAAYFSVVNPAIKLQKPAVDHFSVQQHDLKIPVEVLSPDACPRYSSVTISGVKVGESPKWLKDLLTTIGLRPINNVVDATNFVLHEMGQPLHAFDADKIQGKKVFVKTFDEATNFVTLDGTERKLHSDDLMICDEKHPMCIGGVFGGLTSGVTDDTTNLLLESAYFNPVSIRKTARRHGLNTDASFRFERGCDPNNTIYILKRCALLIQEVAGGVISSDISDIYPSPHLPFEVSVSLDKINKLIGKEIGENKIETILKALEITVLKKENGQYLLQVPTYRVDVQRDVDVIEDILRIYGYNQVETGDFLKSNLSFAQKPDSTQIQHLISEQLTAQGFNEILNNSLTKAAYYNQLSTFPLADCVKLMNPLSNDLNVMRQTLLFGGLESIAYNINRKSPDLKFYEFGNCYYYKEQLRDEENPLKAYSEEYFLSLWLTGQKYSHSWLNPNQAFSVFDLKAYVENILKRAGVSLSSLKCNLISNDIYSEGLEWQLGNSKKLAEMGIVKKSVLKIVDIDQDVYYSAINWGLLLKELKKNSVQFSELPKYPGVKRDLALVLENEVSFASIEEIAFQTERKLLKKVNLFDVYEGKNIEQGKKSYAIGFVLQDESKTLTDSQIDSVMQKLLAAFENKLGAKLR